MQHTSMNSKPFVRKVTIKYAPIGTVMNAADKQRTGLIKLTAQELVNLGTWLNSNAVLAPGNQPG